MFLFLHCGMWMLASPFLFEYKEVRIISWHLIKGSRYLFMSLWIIFVALIPFDSIVTLFFPLYFVGSLNDSPEVMKQMPPLPVKVNEELANSILPRTTLPPQSWCFLWFIVNWACPSVSLPAVSLKSSYSASD